ncbi:MAG TPA: His/Gly/Thr/Pro-type tRNA ligase C-terminal domain-containing protein, partial [bacterium]|nr:His/Gly/Thr/Pro-type tRNA ligase C-terminal domain-containing protein [bacterium]
TWQGPTFQLDFNLPERFDVNFIDRDGAKKRVVMIHRTVLGSMERFMGNLIEHYKGAFPAWLAPVQVRILTITDAQLPYARELEKRLRAASIRCEVDDRNEKIGYKIREAEAAKIPVMLVAGKREAAEGTLAVRERGRRDLGIKSWAEALDYIQNLSKIPTRN